MKKISKIVVIAIAIFAIAAPTAQASGTLTLTKIWSYVRPKTDARYMSKPIQTATRGTELAVADCSNVGLGYKVIGGGVRPDDTWANNEHPTVVENYPDSETTWRGRMQLINSDGSIGRQIAVVTYVICAK